MEGKKQIKRSTERKTKQNIATAKSTCIDQLKDNVRRHPVLMAPKWIAVDWRLI